MLLFSIRQWHFHLELDRNIWLFGVSWNAAPSGFEDVGVYFGPINLQIEKYDRGILSDPKPSDAIDDPYILSESSGDLSVAFDISALTVIARDRTGLPWDIYIASNRRDSACDPRVYIPSCDCPVHSYFNLMAIAIAPRIRLVRGTISSTPDFIALKRWAMLNRPILLRFWNGEMTAGALLRDLKSE